MKLSEILQQQNPKQYLLYFLNSLDENINLFYADIDESALYDEKILFRKKRIRTYDTLYFDLKRVGYNIIELKNKTIKDKNKICLYITNLYLSKDENKSSYVDTEVFIKTKNKISRFLFSDEINSFNLNSRLVEVQKPEKLFIDISDEKIAKEIPKSNAEKYKKKKRSFDLSDSEEVKEQLPKSVRFKKIEMD